MIKALFTFDYYADKIKKFEDLGYNITFINENEIKYSDSIKDIEMMVCNNPFIKLDINKLPKLKWIQLASIGFDHVPKDIVTKNGITVTNNSGGYKIPIGEWIVMDILNLLKNSMSFYRKQQLKRWEPDESIFELYGKTVGFVGTGSIATEAAKRLEGFGVNIIGVNTTGHAVKHFNSCFPMEELDEVLAKSDIVVITIPYTKDTHHLIDEKRIASMKHGAFFINIARGSIVDEQALIKNLQNGKIAAAALDVLEQEPLSKDSSLWNMDNVIITPHNSWCSELAVTRRLNLIYENMRRFAAKEELINVAKISRGY
ncbi:phosphoglycerate dehydrogenase [Clostridium oryzae]|uniref:Putative 2-hydroxyacid dehydrogenase n=1 Tax=Clostridium oryzae TaxID=1450648 RepID=A0A1V4ILK2_9CLOT|nr:phosphoglycerate dehydrogenase [Clostridium oryzae]OPJ60749.1 putative 2-hydroxyacid dehydrogenase [Clostridium oryzae]